MLLDASGYTGCMQQRKRVEQTLLAKMTKYPGSIAPPEPAASLRAIRMLLAGLAFGLVGYALLGVGMLANWPWIVMTGVLLSFLAAILLVLAFIARGVYGD